jgi:uncharacterized protein YdhG (YjbR/CyaY superfamily)
MRGPRATKIDAAVAADPVSAGAWIDAYLAALPADQRNALQTLRETVAATAPQAVETISYGIPAFRYRGHAMVWYHAARAHCSFFPTAEPIEALAADLTGFEHSKGTLKFKPSSPPSKELIEKLVRYRLAQIDAETGDKK